MSCLNHRKHDVSYRYNTTPCVVSFEREAHIRRRDKKTSSAAAPKEILRVKKILQR